MAPTSPKLHLVCGKIAAGKSTLTAKLSESQRTVLIAEDAWLAALFSEEMASVADYVRHSAKLRRIMGPHVSALLTAGLSVVLDFPANTRETRDWMRGILELSNAAHELHLLDVPDEVCLARLRARNAGGDHPFGVNEAQFRQVSKHFRPPTPDEGFNVVVRSADT